MEIKKAYFKSKLLFFIVDLEQIMGASREIKIDHFYIESLLNIVGSADGGLGFRDHPGSWLVPGSHLRHTTGLIPGNPGDIVERQSETRDLLIAVVRECVFRWRTGRGDGLSLSLSAAEALNHAVLQLLEEKREDNWQLLTLNSLFLCA